MYRIMNMKLNVAELQNWVELKGWLPAWLLQRVRRVHWQTRRLQGGHDWGRVLCGEWIAACNHWPLKTSLSTGPWHSTHCRELHSWAFTCSSASTADRRALWYDTHQFVTRLYDVRCKIWQLQYYDEWNSKQVSGKDKPYTEWNEWKCIDLKCVRKSTNSRISLTHHANKFSRWAE